MKFRNAVHAAMSMAVAAGAIGTGGHIVRSIDAQPTAKSEAQAQRIAVQSPKNNAAPSILEALLGGGSFGGGSGRTHYPKRPPGSVARDKRMARKRRNIRARGAK